MGKVRKPTSITTIKDCEEALGWIDVELEKLDRNIRITNRAIFSPKKLTTALSGILWSKQVSQKASDHICNSPFLSKLEGSARSDQNLQAIQLSRVVSTAKEVQAVCEETCSRLAGAVNEARAAVSAPVHVDDRNISALPEAERESIKSHDMAVQVAKREAVAQRAESELAIWRSMEMRASRMADRTLEALRARHAFTACNYEVLSDAHIKWAARRGKLQPPYNLVGVLGTRNVDVTEKEG